MGHPARLGPGCYVGPQRLFLTICTHLRQDLFLSAPSVALVESRMLHVCRREQFAVLAYCFMPSHVHLLVTATGTRANASELVRFLKQETAYVFRKTSGQQLWQRSFFYRTLRSDEDVKDVVSYIVMNPVRAGLAASVGDYPYWGSETYSRSEIVEFVGRPEGRPLHSSSGPT